ncbi:MAG: hypothetical protein ACUVX8_12845 [Candidatus Zipacnadales bacterium]
MSAMHFPLVSGATGLALLTGVLGGAGCAQQTLNAGASGNPYRIWEKGPPSDSSFFPIAVWLQSPKNAARYKAAGINVYVGLWQGPTEQQLADLEAADMPVICHQNEVGLNYKGRIIIGWMHGDEPDNAQPLGEGKGYGPPIPPEKVIADYENMRAADPTRPILLNLGQGVAWDQWYGRGVRTNHPEDYPEYLKGADIVSFDIYPAVHTKPEIAGNLWYVPRGVERLREWTQDRKVVWNCIECTRISNLEVKPTPHQVKAEVWMSLIHGSMGLIYFVHQFQPNFIEAGLLADEEMLNAVTAINTQIHELAPILNSSSVPEAASVSSSNAEVPIDIMVKQYNDATYIFAVAMRDGKTRGSFNVPGTTGEVEVLGEKRTLANRAGIFTDEFEGYGVHLYRVK